MDLLEWLLKDSWASLAFTFLFPATWYLDVMSGAPTAILDDEVNLREKVREIEGAWVSIVDLIINAHQSWNDNY